MAKSKMKLARTLVTLGPVAYQALQDPRIRQFVIMGLGRVSEQLRVMDGRTQNPQVSTLTGKPVNQPQLLKAEQMAQKLPEGLLMKVARGVDAARQQVERFDAKQQAQNPKGN